MTVPRSGMQHDDHHRHGGQAQRLQHRAVVGVLLSPASTRAASSIAMPRMIATLANSEGWSENRRR